MRSTFTMSAAANLQKVPTTRSSPVNPLLPGQNPLWRRVFTLLGTRRSFLLVHAQRGYRVDAGGAARGDEACQKRYSDQ
jgi:hypothetical protein